jgi:hypothetical protein
MASPHTAGAVALLWSAKPQVKGLIRISRCLMTESARSIVTLASSQTCGGTTIAARPNNMFGSGLIDAFGAVHLGPDADADGIANACDCASADGGTYDPPGEAAALGFDADKSTFTWASLAREAGNGTLYDAVRGDLGTLRASGSIAASTCFGTATTATTRSDPQSPAAGDGYYYLVSARNACGIGGWGTTSAGVSRVHAVCP